MKHNFWKTGLITSGVLPFGLTISLLTFYLHTKSILGYYPKYNHPDPKTLDIYGNYSVLVNTSISLWIISFLLTIPLVIAYLIIKRKKINWKLVGFSLISQTIAIILFFSNIFEWYID
jgi:hypothetical protein